MDVKDNHGLDGGVLSQIDYKSSGSVYTPESLASWAASLLLEKLDVKSGIRVLDPACGDGKLLSAVENLIPSSAKLVGVDISDPAVKQAKKRLPNGAILKTADMICPDPKQANESAWRQIIGRPIDGVIANPPWGADISHSSALLKKQGFYVASGQFDSWDLFVELSLRLVKKNGVLALILPDSIFQPEHRKIRELIQKETCIEFIARLGEGFFPGIYRGTAVLVLKKTGDDKSHAVEGFRLNRKVRKQILNGTISFYEARKRLSHKFPQGRFSEDSFQKWDIETKESDGPTFRKIESKFDGWTELLEGGRGVELSKKGIVVTCTQCSAHFPLPKKSKNGICECPHCGATKSHSDLESKKIIIDGDLSKRGWERIVVGEDVDRYAVTPRRIIQAGLKGVNYKSKEIYKKERLLVRKTGIGLKASIVSAGELTNQVVFHYSLNDASKLPKWYLHYVLGVLSSRIMLAYHIRKNGENEWRSHPYVTQKILSQLPIPVPVRGTEMWGQAEEIARNVKKMLRASSSSRKKIDFEIECLVAGLFHLAKTDAVRLERVLRQAEQLEAVNSVRNIAITDISPRNIQN